LELLRPELHFILEWGWGAGRQIFDVVDTVRIVLEERISPAFLEKAFNVFVHCSSADRLAASPAAVVPSSDSATGRLWEAAAAM
jgi:hypothetical protein